MGPFKHLVRHSLADHHVTTSPLNGLGGKNAAPCQKDSNPNAPTPWWNEALEMEWRKWCTKHTEATSLDETWSIHRISRKTCIEYIPAPTLHLLGSFEVRLVRPHLYSRTQARLRNGFIKIGKHPTLGIQIWIIKLLSFYSHSIMSKHKLWRYLPSNHPWNWLSTWEPDRCILLAGWNAGSLAEKIFWLQQFMAGSNTPMQIRWDNLIIFELNVQWWERIRKLYICLGYKLATPQYGTNCFLNLGISQQ